MARRKRVPRKRVPGRRPPKGRKAPAKFLRRMKKKLFFIYGFVMLLLVGLVGRLVYIGQVKGKEYEQQVLSQQGYDSQIIPYQRGKILDTKGTILANSVDVYNLVLDCKQINEVTNKETKERKYLEPTVEAVLAYFPDVTEEEVRAALAEKPDSRYFVLRRKLYYDEITGFLEFQDELNDKGRKAHPNVQGVWFEKGYQREYPNHTLASKILGYTVTGDEGIGGLEGYYNSVLNGINGRQYGYLNTDNNLERTVKEPVNGKSLVTTIDVNVQKIIEQKIAEFQEAHRDEVREGAGSENTAVIVMNPQNGEILAMSDDLVYDPNKPRDLSLHYTKEERKALNKEEKLQKLDRIWQNYCVTNSFEPGSTAKPFTVATGMETGKLREWYECDGLERVGGHEIHCVQRSGHNSQTVEQTVMNSCNDAMMQMAAEIGKEDFYKFQDIFGFGLQTHIDLPGEPSFYYMYNAETTDAASLATNSFGQNFNVTMIQMASAFSSLINGGYYYQPHVVRKILDDSGNTVQEIEPVVLKQTVSSQTSDAVKGYLYSTVSEGTGKSAKVAGYSMGGKTGTAEKGDRTEDRYIVSFIGFAPVEDPKVLVYVVIDEANVAKEKQSSALATAMAKEIFTEILPYLNIFPDEEIPREDGQEASPDGTGEGDGQGADPAGTGEGQEGSPPGEGTGQGQEGNGLPGEGENPDGAGEGTGQRQDPGAGGEGESPDGAGEDTGEWQSPEAGGEGEGTGEWQSPEAGGQGENQGNTGEGGEGSPGGTGEGGEDTGSTGAPQGGPEYPPDGVPWTLPNE